MIISFVMSLGNLRDYCIADYFVFARCIRPAVSEGNTYHGTELILAPPAATESVLIDEGMVSNMLNEYKSPFLTDISEIRKRS